MSDLVKSQAQESKPTRRGGRKTAASDRSKVELKATEQPVDMVAGSTIVEAAIDLADAETAAAGRAYGDRMAQNLPRLGDYFRMVQAKNADAIRKQAFAEFGVTEEDIYGTEADSETA